MEWLNYHHLLYFWVVAREGSIVKATEVLNLTQPTISAQIQSLEESLGEKLFDRVGRRLVLTEAGRTTYRYAEEIFGLGRELRDTLKGRPTGRPARFRVGVADVVPKLIAYRILRPAFELAEPPEIVLREDHPQNLLAQLAVHELDLVIADAPIAAGLKVRAFHHLLGESGVSFFATPKLAATLRKGFPRSLEGAPVLLPAVATELRRGLDLWLDRLDLRPRVVAEFDDSALMKVFGYAGIGAFPASTVIEKEICEQYGLKVIGRIEEIRERYYAISSERKLTHPAVVAITEGARSNVFAEA
ncbi:MAG: transcriptional activator NhaR [Thermoanaerobaculia bacterium]|nr:transcriptional activator NhaR [Thermoanaerobaculia bacterium]